MRIIDLISDRPLIWGLFVLYMGVTSWLAWLGHKRTGDLRSFAIGRGDMAPWVVGITLAASIASTATFVINPGFVYVHGVSALLHLGGSVSVGIILGLVLMSTKFRQQGERTQAVTLPQWFGTRFGSKPLAVLFAGVSLLSLSFVVLIIGGLSIVMQTTLGLSNVESLALVVIFVFGYVFVGGAYAHAYTNTLQGLIMLVVAAIIVGSGLHLFSNGIGTALSEVGAKDPNLVAHINPKSALFGDFFSVYIAGFVIGFALVCQPHIMTKALYVKNDAAVRRSLAIAIAVSTVFSALLLVGLYAHLNNMPREVFLDPNTGAFRQDLVMMRYLDATFSPTALAFITVALMAAGMSTLDGILVALSTIAANDLYLNIAERRWLRDASEADKSRSAHRVSRGILVAMGAVAFLIALHPPKLLGIFGQVGVYGIVAASAAPMLFAIFSKTISGHGAMAAAVVGLLVHFIGYFTGLDANPGVTATWAILASGAVAALSLVVLRVPNGAPQDSGSKESAAPSMESAAPSKESAAPSTRMAAAGSSETALV